MKRNQNRRLVPALIALLLLSACGSKSLNGAMEDSMTTAPAASAPAADAAEGELWDYPQMPAPEPMQPSEGIAGGESQSSPVYRDPNAKLIRRAELNLQTTAFDQTASALEELVSGCGGYFESASVYGGSYRDVNADRRGEYVVRVPAERYENFLTRTGELGYVTSKTESSEDIGEQYYDTQARLKTQQTKQERLLDLLSRAESMEDIISLENALSEVEYQIEQYTSTLNRYDSLVGYSTVSIWLQEVQTVTQQTGVTDSLGKRMAAGLTHSGESLVAGFQDMLVWLSYNVFLVLILAAVAVAAVVVLRRKRWKFGKKRTQDPPA